MEMRTEDPRKINGCLAGTGEHEVQGKEGPWVVWGWDVDDVDVHGSGWMETRPAIGDCYLEGGEVQAEGGDNVRERLPQALASTMENNC